MSSKGSLDMVIKNMDSDRATKILAKTLYKELRQNGFQDKDIIKFSKEMVECLAQDIQTKSVSETSSKKDALLIG